MGRVFLGKVLIPEVYTLDNAFDFVGDLMLLLIEREPLTIRLSTYSFRHFECTRGECSHVLLYDFGLELCLQKQVWRKTSIRKILQPFVLS